MRKTLKKRILLIGVTVLIILIVHPDFMSGRPTYDFIKTEDILANLHGELAVNFNCNAVVDCDYYDMIVDESELSPNLVDGDLTEEYRIREGGEYSPHDCKAKFSTAVIVPYRDRAEQLRGFLLYMHTFLRHQQIHYRIYVIEQVDTRPFNRAKLLNIGAQRAMQAGFPCLILHDVDLLPSRPANLYACTKKPRLMISNINKYRFLPNDDLIGGALSILGKQFEAVNGMSNEYFGWGGEDEDLFARLEANDLETCRFSPQTSQYYVASHDTPQIGEKGKKLLSLAKERMASDGLNSLHYSEVATVLHPLFTHIMVDL